MQPKAVVTGLVAAEYRDRPLQVLLRFAAGAANEHLPARGREHASSAEVSPPATL